MTSSIPDSISRDELLRIQVNAEPDFVPADTLEFATQEELINFTIDNTFDAVQKIGTDFGYKLIADYCIYQLYSLHKQGFQQMSEAGDLLRAEAWAKDAGQLQAMGQLLRNIQVGPQDFQCPMDTDSEEEGLV